MKTVNFYDFIKALYHCGSYSHIRYLNTGANSMQTILCLEQFYYKEI